MFVCMCFVEFIYDGSWVFDEVACEVSLVIYIYALLSVCLCVCRANDVIYIHVNLIAN